MNFRSLVGAMLFALAGWLSAAGAQEKVDPKEPEKGEKPKEIDKGTIDAWKKRGFGAGWIEEEVPGLFNITAGPSPRSIVPALIAPRTKIEDLKDLPVVDVPFALLLLPSTNPTEDVLKQIGTMKNLVHLQLDRCLNITDSTLVHLTAAPRLATLRILDGTEVTDVGLKEVAKIKTLTALHFKGSRFGFTDKGVKELAALSNLTTLRIGEVKVSDATVVELTRLKKLTTLALHPQSITDKSLRALREADLLHALSEARATNKKRPAKAEDVVEFQLHLARITDEGLKELAVFKSLTSLSITSSVITDAGLEHLTGFSKLRDLSVSGSRKITGTGLKHLKTLPELKHLNLQFTGLTAEELKQLAEFKNLTILRLRGVSEAITNADLDKLRQALPKCTIIR